MTAPGIGIHDREGYAVTPSRGWVVDAIALKENPAPTDYTALNPSLNWIVRLNHGWHPDGTIPTPQNYESFAASCANYVKLSKGCTRWIIGNEPNLSGEWPSGQPITTANYARCFKLCRHAIKQVQPEAKVIPAPVAPWNVESGDWILFWRNVLQILGPENCDALAIHSYSRLDSPGSASTDEKMQDPYRTRFSDFRAYQDLMWAIPPQLRHLPVYMTEFNPIPGWQDGSVIIPALNELASWNAQPDTQKIICMVLYRFMNYDRWGFSKNQEVLTTVQSLKPAGPVAPSKAPTSPVSPVPGTLTPKEPETPLRDASVDSRAIERGVRIEDRLSPGQKGWKVTKIQWYNEQEANALGPNHHIMLLVLDENGERLSNVPFRVSWPDGDWGGFTKDKPGEPYAADYPMSASLNEFSVKIDSPLPSEKVTGIGMGANGNPRLHTTTGIVFQRTSFLSPPKEEEKEMITVPTLIHPISGSARITQRFAARPEYYSQFSIDGVPLKGHEGIDFGVPIGTRVRTVDSGRVIEMADTGDRGYGKYIKILHPAWGETVYAHLSNFMVSLYQEVPAGYVIALSGNSGNSTGPHLHFGMRVRPFNRRDGWGGYTDPLPYLSETSSPSVPVEISHKMLVTIIKSASSEFGVDWRLVLSLIHAESSMNPKSVNTRTGASGLGNIMKATWDEWSKKVGASDIFNPKDNARVTAAYLNWCVKLAGSVRRGLWAYNWGIGNVQAGKIPPQETIEFATKVIHGSEVLKILTGD